MTSPNPRCPICGQIMRQTRRGATLAKRGPIYECPVDQAETQRDERGHLYRVPNATHGPYNRTWTPEELEP
jgi:hypothetical protein